MTTLARALAILELFDEEHPVWHTDEINTALGYTRATGYRYVKDLVETGYLQKVTAGKYSLGPQIIELDYRLRRSDPVLLAAVPVMDALAKKTRLDVVLSSTFGSKIIDTYRASADWDLQLSHGRGRPRPLFLSAAPKVILANLGRPQLIKIYQSHAADAAVSGMGTNWTEFRTFLAGIRQEAVYQTSGELQPGITAAAIAIFDADGDVAGALAVVGRSTAIETMGERRVTFLLSTAKDEIQVRIREGVKPSGTVSAARTVASNTRNAA